MTLLQRLEPCQSFVDRDLRHTIRLRSTLFASDDDDDGIVVDHLSSGPDSGPDSRTEQQWTEQREQGQEQQTEQENRERTVATQSSSFVAGVSFRALTVRRPNVPGIV